MDTCSVSQVGHTLADCQVAADILVEVDALTPVAFRDDKHSVHILVVHMVASLADSCLADTLALRQSIILITFA